MRGGADEGGDVAGEADHAGDHGGDAGAAFAVEEGINGEGTQASGVFEADVEGAWDAGGGGGGGVEVCGVGVLENAG